MTSIDTLGGSPAIFICAFVLMLGLYYGLTRGLLNALARALCAKGVSTGKRSFHDAQLQAGMQANSLYLQHVYRFSVSISLLYAGALALLTWFALQILG